MDFYYTEAGDVCVNRKFLCYNCINEKIDNEPNDRFWKWIYFLTAAEGSYWPW